MQNRPNFYLLFLPKFLLFLNGEYALSIFLHGTPKLEVLVIPAKKLGPNMGEGLLCNIITHNTYTMCHWRETQFWHFVSKLPNPDFWWQRNAFGCVGMVRKLSLILICDLRGQGQRSRSNIRKKIVKFVKITLSFFYKKNFFWNI